MKTTLRTATCMLSALLVLAGCMGEKTGKPSEVGTLEMPIRSTGSSGTQFALAATFDLVGPEAITTTIMPGDATFGVADFVSMNPQVGSYMLTISGWNIYSLMIDASGMIVGSTLIGNATLLDSATQPVDILNNQTTSVVYRFAVPGQGTVVFARGTLNIDFTVDEGFPNGAACMQNSDCQSLVCSSGACAAASCSDGVQNGGETGVDCGGAACPACGVAGSCFADGDCPAGETCMIPAGSMQGTCSGSMPQCDPAVCSGMCVDTNGDGVVDTCQVAGATCLPANCVTGVCLDTDGDGNADTCQSSDPVSCLKVNEVMVAGAGGSGDEMIELFNTCTGNVYLSGSRVAYRSATGVNDVVLRAFSGSELVPAGGYFVLTSPTSQYAMLANATFGGGAGALSATGGGIAIRDAALNVVDSVGYGTATNAFVEGMPALAPTAGASLSRIPNGNDSNNNTVDFTVQANPTPGAAN